MTTGVRTFVFFWFSKQPIFWMPKGAVPSYVEWGLSFPRAPQGSVSIQVWSFAVGQMVTLLFAVTGWIVGSFGTRTGQPTEPMKMESKTEAKKAQ